jgi:hypothetical protein
VVLGRAVLPPSGQGCGDAGLQDGGDPDHAVDVEVDLAVAQQLRHLLDGRRDHDRAPGHALVPEQRGEVVDERLEDLGLLLRVIADRADDQRRPPVVGGRVAAEYLVVGVSPPRHLLVATGE